MTSVHEPTVAVIGCGYWGKNLVRNFAQLGVLAAICDDNEGVMRQHASAWGVAGTADCRDIFENDAIRAVVLATPAVTHYKLAKEALLRGKDVFVEKPLALHYHDGAELVELAAERRAVLMVGHILEYHSAVLTLREIMERGELGEIRYVYSNRVNLGKVRQEENILWSFAPHDIAVISRLLGGPPQSVGVNAGSYLQEGIADVTVTAMAFENGVRGHIFVSWLHPFKEQKLVVIGDRRMAVFDDTLKEGKLKIHDKGVDRHGGLLVPRQTGETILYLDETEPMRRECEHFLACIRDRSPALTDGQSALDVLRVLEACELSMARGGLPVDIAEVGMAMVA